MSLPLRTRVKIGFIQTFAVIAFLTSSSAFAAVADGAVCLNNTEAVSDPADVATGDFGAFKAGVPIVKGGVTHPPVRDQKFEEICWSFALNELADALFFKSSGQLKVTSADHNG